MNDMRFARQHAIFNPDAHRAALGRIGLVGCGAIGSAVLLTLTKMGIADLHVWDYDHVELHNTPNQVLFQPRDSGLLKVGAAVHSLHWLGVATGALVAHDERFPARSAHDYDTLIVATDTLASRRGIWNACKRAGRPLRYLDLRMGGQVACRYALSRSDGADWDAAAVERYEPLLVEDSDDQDPCGARSFLPTALLCASLCGFAIAAWARGGEDIPWELYVSHDHAAEPYMARSAY